MKEKFKAFLSLIWLFLCVIGYIDFAAPRDFVHSINIFNIPYPYEKLIIFFSFSYWKNLILAFLGVSAVTLTYTSFGAHLAGVLQIERLFKPNSGISFAAKIATFFVMGSVAYSILFLIFAKFSVATPTSIICALVIGGLLGAQNIRKSISFVSFLHNMQSNRREVISFLNLLIVLVALGYASARLSYDSTAIYFSDAKITAHLQTFQFFKEDTFSASAFQSTIHFTALIQLFGDQSARMFSWICGMVVIIFTSALAEKFKVSPNARNVLIALFLTSTAFTDLLGDGKVDLINSALCMAVIYWLAACESRKELLLVGFLTGMTVTGRPFNAFLLSVFILLFYFQRTILNSRHNRIYIQTYVTPLVFIGLSAIPAGVFYLFLNWALQGSPLAFLNSLSNINLTTGPWDSAIENRLTLRLLYPLISTFRNTPQSLGNISPLILGFLPFILSSKIQKSISQEIKAITAVAILTLTLWVFLFFTITELRYVFFLWFILFIPSAEIIAITLESEDRFFGITRTAIVSLLMLFMIYRILVVAAATYSPIDANKNPQCYDSSLCKYLRHINEIASEGARVLTLGSFRYYLRSDLFACSTSHEEYSTLQKLSRENSQAFWTEVYRQGYQFIAYENDYTTRHLQFGMIPNPENTPSWLTLEPIYVEPGDLEIAYRIHVSNPPIDTEVVCEKNDSQIWEVRPVSQP